MQIVEDVGGGFVEFVEVPDEDCELEADGSGFWYLAAEDDEFEEFFEFEDVEFEDEES